MKPFYIDQFNLFLDDQNLLKFRGRINNANLLASKKKSVLLPSTHLFVKLLVTDAHYKIKHGKVNTTLIALCERYWILRGRQLRQLSDYVLFAGNLKIFHIAPNHHLICQPAESQMTSHFHTLGWTLLAQYILEIPMIQVMEPRHMCDWILENRPNCHTGPIPFYWPS